jgi:hypothetical protein
MAGRSRIPLSVIGGGIGGLAAAIAASRAGQAVHVLEKAEAFAELGAGLQLGPNATRMLDRLGILADVLRTAIFPRFLVMRDAVSGQYITWLDLGKNFCNVSNTRMSSCTAATCSRRSSPPATLAIASPWKLGKRLWRSRTWAMAPA